MVTPTDIAHPGRALTGRRTPEEACAGPMNARLSRLHATKLAGGLLQIHAWEDLLASYAARLAKDPRADFRALGADIDDALRYRPDRTGSAGAVWDRGLPEFPDAASPHAEVLGQEPFYGDGRDASHPPLPRYLAHIGRPTAQEREAAKARAAAGSEDPQEALRRARAGLNGGLPSTVAEHVSEDQAKQMVELLAVLPETVDSRMLSPLCDVLDLAAPSVHNRLGIASRALLGMPRMTAMARAGELSFDRLEHAARASRTLRPVVMLEFDRLVSRCRASKMPYFRRYVAEVIASLKAEDDRNKEAFDRRRVVATYGIDGISELTLVGPTHAIALLEARSRAVAQAIAKGQLDAFGSEVPEDHLSIDERTMANLMFDVIAGALLSTEVDVADASEVQAAADEFREPEGKRIRVTCPTEASWLRRQAGVLVQVPVSTLLDEDAGVPGTINGHPINPEAARRIVGSGPQVLRRIITDPLTGQVSDEIAKAYRIPAALRLALIAKWQNCTAPGCTRPALKAELDHQLPFDHQEPDQGGRTDMAGLHPLCKAHHQLKTQQVLRLTTTGDSEMISWESDGWLCQPISVPESLIGVLDADHFHAMAAGRIQNPSPEPDAAEPAAEREMLCGAPPLPIRVPGYVRGRISGEEVLRAIERRAAAQLDNDQQETHQLGADAGRAVCVPPSDQPPLPLAEWDDEFADPCEVDWFFDLRWNNDPPPF